MKSLISFKYSVTEKHIRFKLKLHYFYIYFQQKKSINNKWIFISLVIWWDLTNNRLVEIEACFHLTATMECNSFQIQKFSLSIIKVYPVREHWCIFVFLSFLHAAIKKLVVFASTLHHTRQARKNLIKKR